MRVRRRQGAAWNGLVSKGEERLYAASVRAHGRITACGLVELREHVLERIPEDLGADHLDAGIEEQLAKSGEEDRGIDAGSTAERDCRTSGSRNILGREKFKLKINY